jgi:hypothetical protein
MKRKMEEDFIFMDTGKIAKIHESPQNVIEDEFNPVEIVLKECNERGMSIKQLMNVLQFTKRKIKHYIYTSRFIEDTKPYLHGSIKQKINVYTFDNKFKDFYFNKKKRKNDIKIELSSSTTD